MKISDIAQLRLQNQLIAGSKLRSPSAVVAHLGAMQAQDYLGALWAIALRTRQGSEADIEKALTQGQIIRTWPMRDTLHFVAAQDVHWLLELLTPRLLRGYELRHKRMGITPKILERSRKVVVEALRGGKSLSRPALYELFEKNGIPTSKSRGLHILGRLGHDRLICFGPRQDKQQTFTLLDEWAKKGPSLSKETALAKLAMRYFTSHGPATIYDFSWWAGLTLRDVRLSLELTKNKLEKTEIEGKTYYWSADTTIYRPDKELYLLPPFDEYIVAYRYRGAVLEDVHAHHVNPGANGMLGATVVDQGQVIGTWKRAFKKDKVILTPKAFTEFNRHQKASIIKRALDYEHFLGLKSEVVF